MELAKLWTSEAWRERYLVLYGNGQEYTSNRSRKVRGAQPLQRMLSNV